ncbi:hypothetical protein LZ30DRAFT_779094 [Colletotrichum cereale]|nr:hypothetical protein LZ30DRAFT_779094 [Colletotrichum cereale]
MPEPVLQKADILVQVDAAGVTGDEILWPELYETASRIPGHELSGTISELGPEYPGPLVSVLDHGKVTPGMRFLVTGAFGAVDRVAVQLAARLVSGDVVALASPRNHDILRQLGTEEVIDYDSPVWESKVEAVDIVFDTVGGTALKKTWEAVKEDGLIVTVEDPPPSWAFENVQPDEAARRPNVRYKYFIVSPNAERLFQASDMIDAGLLRPLMVKPFVYEEAESAWAYARQRGREQKVVIDFR